ncbi:NAD(P)-binding domain-containing protein [Actinoplanes sp. TBRC 11911]|nr:NAD(P)-binding domain-containing protein [Actinoplanes sp. TBRC 11911]
MKTIGLIGAGHIGGVLAELAVTAGYNVVLSNSRGPETLTETVEALGPHASAASAASAAESGDLVVVSIPFVAYESVPVEPLAGKTVIDTNNYYPARDGVFPAIEDGSTSASKLLAGHLPASHVVKAFNGILFSHLASLGRPAGAPGRSALPIAGDDAEAKAQVTDFLHRIGYDVVDAGPLAEDWRFRPATPAYGIPFGGGRPDFWAADPHPAGADEIRRRLQEAEPVRALGGELPDDYDPVRRD